MLLKYTSLILLMIQYDCVPKAAGGVLIWALTTQENKIYYFERFNIFNYFINLFNKIFEQNIFNKIPCFSPDWIFLC